jgi:diphthamide synthase subunit DPH2
MAHSDFHRVSESISVFLHNGKWRVFVKGDTLYSHSCLSEVEALEFAGGLIQ